MGITTIAHAPGALQGLAHRLADVAQEISVPFHRDISARRPERNIANLLVRSEELGVRGEIGSDLELARATYLLGDHGAAADLLQRTAGTVRSIGAGTHLGAAEASDVNHAARLVGGHPDDLLTDGYRF